MTRQYLRTTRPVKFKIRTFYLWKLSLLKKGKDLLQTKLQQILQNNDVSISENNTCLAKFNTFPCPKQVLFSDINISLFCKICCNLVCSKSLPINFFSLFECILYIFHSFFSLGPTQSENNKK